MKEHPIISGEYLDNIVNMGDKYTKKKKETKMDRETYVAIKNVIKNELKITREDIIEIIREEVRKEIPRFLSNTYKDEGIKQLIDSLIARKIDDALKNKLTDGVSTAIRKVFDENYSMQIVKK